MSDHLRFKGAGIKHSRFKICHCLCAFPMVVGNADVYAILTFIKELFTIILNNAYRYLKFCSPNIVSMSTNDKCTFWHKLS